MRILNVRSRDRTGPTPAAAPEAQDSTAAETGPAAAASTALRLGQPAPYSVYTEMGELLVAEGEPYTIEHQRRRRAWGDAELYGLDAAEADAVKQYSVARDVGMSTEVAPDELPELTLEPGSSLATGMYQCGQGWLYADGDLPELTAEEVEDLLTLEAGTYRAVRSDATGRCTIRPLQSHIMDALVYGLHVGKRAARLVPPPAQEPVALEAVEPDASLTELRRPAVTRLRSTREKDQMGSFFDEAVSSLDHTLNVVGRGRTRLGATAVMQHRELVEGTLTNSLQDGNLLASFLNDAGPDHYLIGHASKVAVLSVDLATRLGLSKRQVLEVGQAALVQGRGHEPAARELAAQAVPADRRRAQRGLRSSPAQPRCD